MTSTCNEFHRLILLSISLSNNSKNFCTRNTVFNLTTKKKVVKIFAFHRFLFHNFRGLFPVLNHIKKTNFVSDKLFKYGENRWGGEKGQGLVPVRRETFTIGVVKKCYFHKTQKLLLDYIKLFHGSLSSKVKWRKT